MVSFEIVRVAVVLQFPLSNRFGFVVDQSESIVWRAAVIVSHIAVQCRIKQFEEILPLQVVDEDVERQILLIEGAFDFRKTSGVNVNVHGQVLISRQAPHYYLK